MAEDDIFSATTIFIRFCRYGPLWRWWSLVDGRWSMAQKSAHENKPYTALTAGFAPRSAHTFCAAATAAPNSTGRMRAITCSKAAMMPMVSR